MLFHLLTIQNSNSDDTVFHGFDYEDLRRQVAAECRSDWHHGMAHREPVPDDEDELIEAFFLDHDRLFLVEQEFALDLPEPYASAPQLLESLQALFEHCSMPHKRWGENSNQREADAAIQAALQAIESAAMIAGPEDEDLGNPDCTACNDGSCPWCQAEKDASADPRLTLEQAMALHSGDEVTWNDPDEGTCTCTFTIQSIQHHSDDLFKITKMDGGHLEALASELS